VGMPSFGTLFTPAMTLVSEGAQHQRLDQGLAFGLGNLVWAAGQAVAAVGSGALAQATSDLVPYSLLAAACLATLGLVRIRHRPAALPPRVYHAYRNGPSREAQGKPIFRVSTKNLPGLGPVYRNSRREVASVKGHICINFVSIGLAGSGRNFPQRFLVISLCDEGLGRLHSG
jgi:MFS family permease